MIAIDTNLLHEYFLKNIIDDDGFVVPKAIATQFHTTIKDVAVLPSLPKDSLSKKVRVSSQHAQMKVGMPSVLVDWSIIPVAQPAPSQRIPAPMTLKMVNTLVQ